MSRAGGIPILQGGEDVKSSTTGRRGRVAQVYGGGASIRQTAAECGVSPKTVHRDLIAAEVPRRETGSYPRRKRVPLTPALVAAMAADYENEQATLHTLAQRYGPSDTTIARALRRAGVQLRPPCVTRTRPRSRIDAGRLERLWREGRSVPEIATSLGCSTRAVYAGMARLKAARADPNPTAAPAAS